MIIFDNVTKVYKTGARPALDRVSLEVSKGELVFLVGESGSGKSTCLHLLLRQEKATSGQVRLFGKDISKLSSRKVPKIRRQLGCVFQDFRLLPDISVQDNVALAIQVIGESRQKVKQAVGEALELVGLEGKGRRLPTELSGGEQQRVAVARAMVNKPALLLADEPTGNLDPKKSLSIMSLLERINRTGTTIIMATHDSSLVDQFRMRVIELSDGQVVRDDAQGVYGGGK